ncbi:MAG: hypothetical protein WA885_13715 [Phormidesmis sp.]
MHRRIRLAATVGLLGMLGACALTVPQTAGDTNSEATVAASDTTESTAEVATDSPTPFPDSPPEIQNCQTANFVSKPLSTPENQPVFEQLNFQPQSVTVYDETVAVKTPYYTFHYCRGDNNWIALSNEATAEEPYDYAAFLANIADPDFETIEVKGESYQYRVRLQASWLDEQLDEQIDQPTGSSGNSAEDTVYFELKTPDGEIITEQLYTLSELQAANLGASLGVPRMAGAASVKDTLWLAATTSQGEGDNGFASLLQYDLDTKELSVHRPEEIQGDQITHMVAIASSPNKQANQSREKNATTLWLGTQRGGEGNPHIPASGLVAYQPETKSLQQYTITNSSLVGAIPHQLAVENEQLWVATGNGTCRVQWQTIDQADSWDCWRLKLTAELPEKNTAVYPSLLAAETEATLSKREAEVLWVSQAQADPAGEAEAGAGEIRYEIVYEPGFETQLSQGGYRVANSVAKRATGGESIVWPGNQWHWRGDRFSRGLDEVALNLVGGGPYGLVTGNSRTGFSFDHNAIRGDFDLLSLSPEGTKVRHYSGWIDGAELEVYPRLVPVQPIEKAKPNPLTEIAADLPASSGP